MDFCMAIQARTGIHPVGLRRTSKIVEIRIDCPWVACCVMATLAKQGHTIGQKLPMIAPVDRVAGFTIFFNGRMLPKERTALFRMTFVTQFVDRAAFNKFIPKTTMMVMAVRTFYFTFFYGMMRLLGNLGSNTPVAGKTQFRLRGLQIHFFSGMNRMAVVAGDAGGLVRTHIPMGKSS